MIAFMAWTPLHLINCMNVKLNFFQETDADLYIFDDFKESSLYYKRLDKLKIFNRVLLIDHTKMSSGILKYYDILLNKNRFTGNMGNIYDEIFIEGGNYFSKILFSHNQKRNPNLKLNYIEDGIAPYLNGRIFSTTDINRMIYSLFNKNSIFKKNIDNYYVYEPDLVDFPNEKTTRLPKITKHNPCYEYVLKVFYNDKEVKNTILFIDQPLKDDSYGVDEFELAKNVNRLNRTGKKFIVKQHPRSKRFWSDFKILNINTPFEVLILCDRMESSVIVSPISTISFSSYLMFGIEIETILLSQLILNEYNSYDSKHEDILMTISSFTRKFNKVVEKKIFLPDNYTELEKKLGELKNNE